MKNKSLSDLYKAIGEKYGVHPETVEEIERDFWLQIRQSVGKKEGKQFLIHEFGSFYVPPSRVERYKRHVQRLLDLEEITESDYNRRIKRLEKILWNHREEDTNS